MELGFRASEGVVAAAGTDRSGGDVDDSGQRQCPDWDFLPGDLLARILSRLPFSSLLRARCVCRKWNELNFSSDFTFSGNSASKCVPVYFFEGPLRVYNSRTNAWEEHSLEFVGLPLNCLVLLASAGGLLCFKNRESGEFVVCNPITKRWRVVALPGGFHHEEIRYPMEASLQRKRRSRRDFCTTGKIARIYSLGYLMGYEREFGREVIVAFLPQKHDKSFRLLVAGIAAGGLRTTLIYDSLTRNWSRGSEVPRGMRFWESGKTLFCNGYLYCVTWSGGFPARECDLALPWSVVRYDVAENRWSEYPLPKSGTILPQLVEHRGRGFVVQREFSMGETEIFFMEIKEREPMSRGPMKAQLPVWGDVSVGKDGDGTVLRDWCVGQGDRIYLTCTKPRGLTLLTYDLTMNVWIQLPTLRNESHPSLLWLHTFKASITAAV